MTKLELIALEWLNERRDWANPNTEDEAAGVRPGALRSLAHKGYAEARRFGEHFRGEGRYYWTAYLITAAGRAALAGAEDPSHKALED